MTVGRPRTTSFEPNEMEELGKEMVEWVKTHPDTLHLSEWYTIEKMYTYNQWKSFYQLPEFLPYYEKALKLVGRKYLDKESKVREGASQRWQRVYFKDLREEEDETAAYNASLKVKEEHPDSPNQSIIDSDHKIMILEAKLEAAEEKLRSMEINGI